MSDAMTFADLFSGIGGFRLGLERAGMQCRWACEIDAKRRAVYAINFGHEPQYRDIRECVNAPYVDVICGGFPCQPFSVAGKQRGAADDRNLWPEMLRVIGEVRPMWVVGENVPGIGNYLDTIYDGLAGFGYETLPLEIPAAAFGAPHLRYRTFIISHAVGQRSETGAERPGRETRPDIGGRCAGSVVAHAERMRRGESADDSDRAQRPLCSTERKEGALGVGSGGQAIPDSDGRRREQCDAEKRGVPIANSRSDVGNPDVAPANARSEAGRSRKTIGESGWWESEPGICRVVNGLPGRVDRLAALGNAVVPQVVEWIGRRIMEANL